MGRFAEERMNPVVRRALFSITAAAVCLSSAFAQLAPQVNGDTYVQGGSNSAQNFGLLANIAVGPGGAAPTPSQGLVQFDLSGMTGAGGVLSTDVQKAVLWFWVNR